MSSQTVSSETVSSQTLSAQTSRINGAKSHGPVTAEGKARSARNAIKHGLKSDMIVLEHEDRQAFEQLRESYMDDFHPANQSQADLVETMVAARWRMNRVFMIEGQLLEKEMALHRKEVEKRFSVIEPEGHLACAFETLSQGKTLSLYLRYEAQINRTYERAFKQLQQLQSRQPEKPSRDREGAEEIPNEPKPILILPDPRPSALISDEQNEPEPPSPPESTPDLPRETPDVGAQ